MATDVNQAFREFQKNYVDIDTDKSKQAKGSRDWLMGKIVEIGSKVDFPKLYEDINLHYGSFARKTKLQPLDDIDMMIGLSGQGSTYLEGVYGITINVPQTASLYAYCNENSDVLNSKKIINLFKNKLQAVPQYRNATIKRNEAACVLELVSYDWSFDIVPCFYTVADSQGRSYYLIPDGNGNWKKTDPRIDAANVTNLNQQHNGNILKVIRLAKYWQKRPTMPAMSSYLLEVMVLNYFRSKSTLASEYPDVELPHLFLYIGTNIYHQVTDPKGISSDINDLSWEDRNKIAERAKYDANRAMEARNYESNGDQRNCINKWREIFGDEFPKYE